MIGPDHELWTNLLWMFSRPIYPLGTIHNCIVLIHCCIVLLMSRVRERPTREETSQRVLDAAISVFQEQGIANASIGAIVSTASLTRGAFYSSFANKDEIVVALLEQHVAQAIARNQQLAEQYANPTVYLAALASDEARDLVSLGRLPMLNFELMLYAIRAPEHRPAVSKLLQSLRKTIGQIVVTTMRAAGVTRELDPLEIGSLLVALEDGFDLHRLIDPKRTPKASYQNALRQLQELLLDAPRTPTAPRGGKAKSRSTQ